MQTSVRPLLSPVLGVLALAVGGCLLNDKAHTDLLDPDGDGYTLDEDCVDKDPNIHPGAEEIWYDGTDQDCDGASDFDQDSDGEDSSAYGGTDCDDQSATIGTAQAEVCDGLDNDCDGLVDEDATDALPWPIDADGDGYGDEETVWACALPEGASELAGDCDDQDATRHPGAVESCDGVDQDCDSTVDEDASDATAWYADIDGDTYGAGSPQLHCDPPAGWVSRSGDCEADDATVYPGAPELCDGQGNNCEEGVPSDEIDDDGDGAVECVIDGGGWDDGPAPAGGDCDDDDASTHQGADETCGGLDEDCDGTVDEPSAIDAPTWYPDLDLDGYGGDSSFTVSCVAPSGALSLQDDCDDTDDTVHPGASELCDGLDNDCDGSLPATEVDDDGDGDVDCPLDAGGWDGAAGISGDDCDDAEPTVYVGAPEICDDGQVNDCALSELDAIQACRLQGTLQVDGSSSKIDAVASVTSVTGPKAGSQFGRSFVLPGDVTGSGGDDLVVAAARYTSGSSSTDCAGQVFVLEGGFTATSSSAAWATWTGSASVDRLGTSLAMLPDFDGDGDLELLLGAEYESSGATQGGAVYLLTGGVGSGSSSVGAVDWATWSLSSSASYAGTDVAGLDDDGDGLGETVLIGADRYDVSGANAEGAVFLVRSPSAGGGSLSASTVMIQGAGAGDWLGESVAAIGDLDGDNDEDFAVASVQRSTVYVFLDAPSSTVKATDADCIITGDSKAETGASIQGGDLTGDGAVDLILGSPGASPSSGADAGTVTVIAWDAARCNGTLSALAYATLEGTVSSEGLGDALSLPGDLDRDGRPLELAVGATAAPGGAYSGSNNGRLYLWYGPLVGGTQSAGSADLILEAEVNGSRFGGLGDGQYDHDGDGFPELVVSAYSWSTGGSALGKVVVLGVPGI